MTLRIAAQGDVRLATESFGNPTGIPVVLLMGATASMLWWPEELCHDLAAAGLFVIRYDHRDTGQSTSFAPGPPDYSVEDMTDDLFAVLDAYGLLSAHLVGMSLGGLIAQVAALTKPERVRSLTLIGSEPLGWTGPELPGIAPEFLEHFAGFAELDWADRDAVTSFLLTIARLSANSDDAFDSSRETARIAAELDRATDIRSAFNHGIVVLRDDWSGRLPQVSQPALVIHGREDPILPLANGEALASTLPESRLVVLDGVGHELPARVLPRISDEISRFVSEQA